MSDKIDVAGLVERLHKMRKESWIRPTSLMNVRELLREAADALAALERENAALREDREMLDWLSEQHGTLDGETCQHSVYVSAGQDIRAAIRAARGQ